MDSEKVARKLEKRWKTLENQEKLLIGRICVAFECFFAAHTAAAAPGQHDVRFHTGNGHIPSVKHILTRCPPGSSLLVQLMFASVVDHRKIHLWPNADACDGERSVVQEGAGWIPVRLQSNKSQPTGRTQTRASGPPSSIRGAVNRYSQRISSL